VGRSTGRSSFQKTIRTADIERAQAAHEAELRGTPELRATLHPGGMFKLTANVMIRGQADKYDELGLCKNVPVDHPRSLRVGAILMMINIERLSFKTKTGVLRRPCYTFLIMGRAKRCVLATLDLITPC
jgi:hypothetical protein